MAAVRPIADEGRPSIGRLKVGPRLPAGKLSSSQPRPGSPFSEKPKAEFSYPSCFTVYGASHLVIALGLPTGKLSSSRLRGGRPFPAKPKSEFSYPFRTAV